MNQFDNLFFEQNSNFIDSELETMEPTIRFPNIIRLEDRSLELELWFRNILRKQWRELEV